MALQNISQFFSDTFLAENFTKSLGEEFVLCENGNMVFHWADYHETCDLIKQEMQDSPELLEDFKLREEALKRLDHIPVWVRTDKKIHQTTMFELYEKYIFSQNQFIGGIDPFYPIDLSFISGTGPFKGMSIAECFNQTTYKDFVLVNLIKGRLPKRDFRIRLKSKILIEYGEDFKQAQLVAIEQLTSNGMLISMDADIFMKKMSDSKSMRILINTEMLHEGIGKSLPELKAHLSQFAFNLLYSSRKEDALEYDLANARVQSSFDFSRSKKVYLFMSFEKLQASYPDTVKGLRSFVEHTKNIIRAHYQEKTKAKSA